MELGKIGQADPQRGFHLKRRSPVKLAFHSAKGSDVQARVDDEFVFLHEPNVPARSAGSTSQASQHILKDLLGFLQVVEDLARSANDYSGRRHRHLEVAFLHVAPLRVNQNRLLFRGCPRCGGMSSDFKSNVRRLLDNMSKQHSRLSCLGDSHLPDRATLLLVAVADPTPLSPRARGRMRRPQAEAMADLAVVAAPADLLGGGSP